MKKIFAILTFCLMIFTCVACGSTPETIDVSGVTFESITVDYDGEAHSIECKNVPDGVTVSYAGNGVRKVGVHNVTATLKDADGNILAKLKAKITIKGEEVDEPSQGGGEDNPTEGGGEDDPSIPVDSDYVIEVNGEQYALEENYDADLSEGNDAEYMVLGLTLYAGDEVVFYYLGDVITQIGPHTNGSNLSADEYTPETGVMYVRSDCDSADVYFKIWPDGGYSVYVTGLSTGNGGGEVVEGYITLYFSVTKGWDKVMYYAWMADGDPIAAWPGEDAEFVEVNGYGQNIYKCTIDLSLANMIIFNNGSGDQTSDISLDGVANNTGFYIGDNGEIGTYTYGA